MIQFGPDWSRKERRHAPTLHVWSFQGKSEVLARVASIIPIEKASLANELPLSVSATERQANQCMLERNDCNMLFIFCYVSHDKWFYDRKIIESLCLIRLSLFQILETRGSDCESY